MTVPEARRRPTEPPDERPPGEWDALVRVAERSPRLPGARPWWVAQHDSALELRTATVHGRSAGAAGLRETRISAGAALFAMRLALAAQGCRPYVALLPDPERPEVLALRRRGAPEPARPLERRLLALVDAPPVDREPVAPDSVRYALRRAAVAEGAWLRSAADPAGLAAMAAQLGTRLPQAALYVLLGGDGDVAVGHVRTGQALHRVLLTAAWLGLPGRVLGGPAGLLPPGGRPVDARAPRPLVLLGIGTPEPPGGPRRDQRPGDPGRTAGCARPGPVRR